MAHTITLETNELTALLKSIKMDKEDIIIKVLLMDKFNPLMASEANDFIDMYTKVAAVAIESGECSDCRIGTVQELQNDWSLIKAHIDEVIQQ